MQMQLYTILRVSAFNILHLSDSNNTCRFLLHLTRFRNNIYTEADLLDA